MQDKEISFIRDLAGSFKRNPLQANALLEADAEILSLRHLHANNLVIKCDGIFEEIAQGLYTDPYLIGWMCVTASVSDLAATGADPLGVLLSLQLSNDLDSTWLAEFKNGISEACETYNTFVLGGDTNFGKHISIGSTAVGVANKTLQRKGITEGNRIYSTARLGVGNAFAYSRFLDNKVAIKYKPAARLRESELIREFALACIDTSDGLFPALSALAYVNGTGIKFKSSLEHLLCSETQIVYANNTLPAWMLLAGPHGEYELLFAIEEHREQEFANACKRISWSPVLLGEATGDGLVYFTSEDVSVSCHPAEISNLFTEADGDVDRYYNLLLQKHRAWCSHKSLNHVNHQL